MYSCLRISGDDRHSFLQGQLTQNLDRLTEAGTLPTAWCTPKGRVLLTGRLVAGDDDTRLFLPAQSIEPAIARFTMYRLRAKVEFEVDETQGAVALPRSLAADRLAATGAAPPQDSLTVAAAGAVWLVAIGDIIEAYGPVSALDELGLDAGSALAEDRWREARIRAGCPDIDPGNAERFTPHMLNLDKLGALSFDKGCYTGQEVVARTEHLGKAKRRLQPYCLIEATAAIGDKLSAEDADVGEVVNVAGDVVLAVVSVDRQGEKLSIEDGLAEPLPLPYAID